MNSLLKRQVRKYLSEELKENKNLDEFLSAIDRSYNNYDEHSAMIQRAMAISSEELFAANKQLRIEAREQKELIVKLKSVINKFGVFDINQNQSTTNMDISGLKLVDFIEGQAKEIVEMSKEKESLLSALSQQNQELSDYAHMVSHDLKSPLRNIDTLTSWLLKDHIENLDTHSATQLQLIRTNVQKMDTLISGILSYSTVCKGDKNFYDVDLNVLIKNTIASINIPKGFKIKVNPLPIVSGDKSRLIQLFQNLLENAIKYNDKEKGQVEIGGKDNGEYWQFYVKDNGKGINEKYFDRIFKTFVKLENTAESSGIGLSIVKKIIEFYSGKIWLTSEIKKGTTFFFTIQKNHDRTA